ncbi:photosystem II stability/assembly factor-like uncharacterized protein [Metabacillus crassostreae]|uniref:WD40/YVTN/BNR-like repeat-containing protein n=1 Tax=Metabacillus crassostreae TaxID=929098 RepID=UPI00195B18D7|nr:sialidase family protein [Metabacillus crassostreae]MBM7602932.1 photosystem II stability/assembly factor-like uncharacterized protein [Metabacillus crassostreae]
MKMLIGVVTSIMIVGLIVATIYFYQSSNIPSPEQNQLSGNINKEKVEQLQPISNTNISYTLQNDELSITFNNGLSWRKVPVEKDHLFKGEYKGNKQELIEKSYFLSDDMAAFLYTEGENVDHQKVIVAYSKDKGATWKNSVVTEKFSPMRYRKIDFLNENFGYVIISGGRTMSFESSHIFVTHDGGVSWKETANSGVTSLISDGGFIDETTGFLSFGTINPTAPELYFTHNTGETWRRATISVPEKYQQIFVSAEIPIKEGNHLAIYVNQGHQGDYEGGKIKGKFISEDKGKTWEFEKEDQAIETK